MRDLKQLLTPDDKHFLEHSSNNTWVPKEPRKVLLPYETESKTKDSNNISNRRKEAKKVYDNYSSLIDECKTLETKIEDRCKNVNVTLSKSSNQRIIEAMGRVFGVQQEEITFEHYKICIKALAELNNDLPKPGDK